MADQQQPTESGAPPHGTQQQASPTPIEVNEAEAISTYANFCRVTGTPEELIIDFGLNSQPMGTPNKPLKINQRIILNFFTAKRLLGALQVALQRHEGAFGVLEVDVNKRVKQQQQPPRS